MSESKLTWICLHKSIGTQTYILSQVYTRASVRGRIYRYAYLRFDKIIDTHTVHVQVHEHTEQ